MSAEIRIPLRVSNPNNGSHGHWALQAKKRRHERGACLLALRQHKPPALPCVVHLARVAPRAMDGDNLRAALKSVRDEVAAWLGLPRNKRGQADDGDHRVHWRYAQGKGARGEYAVIVYATTVDQADIDILNAGEVWPCAQ